MIDAATLATYLAVLLGFVFLPGPATLLTLARSARSGTRVGLATGLGIAVGDIIHTAMTIIGLSAVIFASAVLFGIVKYAGAAYLVYLGIRAVLERTEPGHLTGISAITPGEAFKQAVIAEVLNPKSAMFFLAFLPQFVTPQNGAVALQLAILGILFVALGLLSTVTVALFSGSLGTFLQRNASVRRWQGMVLGAIYLALGARLVLVEK